MASLVLISDNPRMRLFRRIAQREVALVFALLLLVGSDYGAWTRAIANTPLTLQEAVKTALAQHPTIRVGEATISAAQQRVRQQEAGYLPRGSYTYTLSRQQRPVTAAVGGVQIGGGQQTRSFAQIFNFHTTNVSLSQVLFDFGRTLDAIQSAAATVEASTADLETTRQTVTFNTKQSYFGLLSSQHLQRVAEETVRQNQKHLEDAQARFEVGVAPRFDVTQAQVQVSNAELNLVTARNNVALGHETLRTAMGITDSADFVPIDTLDRRSLPMNESEILRQAYASRPELHSLWARQKATTEQVSELQKRYLPSLTGNAQYNWTGRDHPLQEGWVIGVVLTVPLFDSILTRAQIGEAQANQQRLSAEEENLRQQITLEVRRSLLDVRRSEESIRVSEQTEVQARENLALAEGRYQAGVGNILEVTDAQTSLTSARANTIQALYNYKTAVAQLEKAVGRALE
ncbi:MAG: TolC family protein [Deltaproteobacteria bacterium]|nr:TolC family protein [Deltaproteobacteria bacterium]